MTGSEKKPTERGAIVLKRLEELSWSMAELERRSHLSKNTIANAVYGSREPQKKTIEILAETLGLPVEALARTETTPPSMTASFTSWLFRRDNPFLWIGAVGSAATGLLLTLELPSTSVSAKVQGTQAFVILLFLVMLPRPWMAPEVYERASQRLKVAAKAARDLRRYWGVVWLLWFFLYAVLTAAALLGFFPQDAPTAATRWASFVLNLIQNGATIQLFLCYEVLARPTIQDDLSRRQVLPREAWWAVMVLVTGAELGWILYGSWPGQQVFSWVSGFGQGTALALLIGRLDSKYVDPPAIVVGLLYFYAAIQGAWPAFQNQGELMMVLTFVALVLKCLLFVFVSWLFASHVIQFYLTRMRKLDQDVRLDRSEFLARYRAGYVERL